MTRRICLILLALAALAAAQTPIRYTVRFPAPHTHYLEVIATVPAAGTQVELMMPVWTPGSYLVREYARNVEGFEATAGGKQLRWEKTRKNRWKVETGGAASFEARYKVYAHEMSVQGNWVDAGFAMLNGAPNFMTIAGAEKRGYEVKLELPPSWQKSISGLKRKAGERHTYVAADYDELIDCPIYSGNAAIHEFEVEGKKHYLVNEGEGPMWDGPASARDVKKIVEENARMWAGLPYEHYVFFNMLVESGGGLEHKNSTWLGASRWAYGNTEEAAPGGADPSAPRTRRASRLGWLGLVSHEYFHVWNVKRLRPVELGPFDYENEVYTRSLWIAEGLTSYYGPLALARARLSTRDQFLRAISGAIGQLQSAAGRLVQPVETASYDAWIKLYRPNENSSNTSISYYTKGEVIGFLLDAKVRKLTGDKRSLDDVMKLAYSRFGGEKGFTPEQFRQTASEVAGADLTGWFRSVLETTAELDYAEALDWFGLRFRGAPQRKQVATGLTANTASGRIVVSQVRRGTAGWSAGVNVDDEIVAVNGYRVRAEQWPARLDSYTSAKSVELLVARRDKLMNIELPITLEAAPGWSLEVKSDATEEQKARLKSWLRQ